MPSVEPSGSDRKVGLVTDSTSQIAPALVQRFDVSVVPINVTIDGEDFAEGVDIDADGFYARFVDGPPVVTTSQPSPGAFAAVYSSLVDAGCDAILSVHVGSALSGTVNSARLGAGQVSVPVEIVDTGTASFGVSCCVWEAAAALADGATVQQAADIALQTADIVRSVFLVQALDFAQAGGRLTSQLDDLTADAIPVMATGPRDAFDVVGEGRSVDGLCRLMADTMHADGQPIRVAVGVADATAAPFTERLDQLLRARDDVVDLVHYRVGPSIGAHTGPGTAGGFWYPIRH